MDRGLQKVRQLTRVLPLVLRCWGNVNKQEVVVGGSRAYIDWNTRIIHIPTLPVDGKDAEIYAFGYGGHESAHVAYTDPKQKTDLDETSEIQCSLYQSIEDVRIERKQKSIRPGIGIRINQMVNKLVENGEFGKPDADCHPAQKLKAYVLYRLRHELLGQKGLSGYAPLAEEIFRDAVPPGLSTKVNAILARVQTAECTRDSVDISRQILVAVRETIDDLKEENQDPLEQETAGSDTDSQGEADDSEEVSSPDNTGDTDLGNSDDPSSSESTDSPDDIKKSGNSNQNSDGAENGSGDTDDSDESATSEAIHMLQTILDAGSDDVMSDVGEAAAKALEDIAEEVERTSGGAGAGYATEPMPLDRDPTALIREVQRSTRALRTKLVGALQTWDQSFTRRSPSGNRLDCRRLADIEVGETDIFLRKRKISALETDIIILMDRSYSMKGSPQKMAVHSALSLGLALDAIAGVESAVATFPGMGAPVQPLSQFGEKVRRTAARYAGVTSGGGTPLGEALLWAYEQLAYRSSNRQLVLIMSDGEPEAKDYVKQLIVAGQKGGIEVYGVGMDSDDGRDIFPAGHWEYITNLEQLPTTVFGLVHKGLLRVA